VRRFSFALAAAFVFLGAALPATAQIPEIPPGKWWKRPRVVESLHVTPDQQERLEEIFAKHRRSFVDLKADVERRQIDVEDLLAKKDSDPKKVSSAMDALDEARLRLGKARTMMIVEMKGVLTADQWQMILERMEEWRRERSERRGMGMRPGGRGGRPDRGGAEKEE